MRRQALIRAARWITLGLSLAGLAAVLSGCATPYFLEPESKDARTIQTVAWILLGICVAVFLVVEGLLIVSLVRSRTRPDEEVKQVYGNTALETLWTVIPVLIVIGLFVVTVVGMRSIQDARGEMPIKVTGHRWWWGVEYQGGAVVTANEIHAPSDQSLDVSLTSADVIHSFWVPQLGGKTDMIPPHATHTSFTDMEEGTYLGRCAEFCGAQHARMRFWVIVESPAKFQAWLRRQQQPAAEPTTDDARKGRDLFLSQPCLGCHTIRGTAAQGMQGPDLTHMGGRMSIAAATLKNVPENMERWLRDPQEVKPLNQMPQVPLNAEQIRLLTAYLEGLE